MEKLFIKNMVCGRCITAVEHELNKLGIPASNILLGEVTLEAPIDEATRKQLAQNLEGLGFELIEDRNGRIIEKIKNTVIQLVHHQHDGHQQNLSEILSSELHMDYSYLSKLFSEVEGTTIEKYYIAQKIEKVKELLVYDELSLSEIADRLNYSSVAYLSNQFKKITGLSPSHFKKIGLSKRKPLDKV
jgi:AraC-like DNA-binding protein